LLQLMVVFLNCWGEYVKVKRLLYYNSPLFRLLNLQASNLQQRRSRNSFVCVLCLIFGILFGLRLFLKYYSPTIVGLCICLIA